MKKVGFFILSVLLTAEIGLGSGYSQEKNMETNSADAAGQEKTASAAEFKVKKIGLSEARKIVAARVNGTDITLDAVMQMTGRMDIQMTHAHSSEGPSVEALQKEAIDRLILQELAYQKAKARGIAAEQKSVDVVLADMKTKAGGEEEYRKSLEKSAMTEEQLRAKVEKNLILETIFKQEVLDKISVSGKEIKEDYEKNKGFFTQPEKISVVDVVISQNLSNKGAEIVAEEVLNKIRENSNDPNKLVQDGTFIVRNYEPKRDNDNDNMIYEVARTLSPGEISSVLKAGDGLHIIRLVEYMPQKVHTFEEVRGFIEKKLRNDEQNQKTREWLAGLKKDAKIEIIVHEVQAPKVQTPK